MEQAKAWQGTTDGGSFGQRAMLGIFRYADVRVGYFIVALTVPFYMLGRRKNAGAIYRYFRQRHGYGRMRSLWSVYRNHCIFGNMLIDRFACYAGHAGRFRVTVDGEERFSRLTAGQDGFLMGSAHAGNFEMAGYLLQPEHKKIYGLIYEGEAAVMQQQREQILTRHRIGMIPVRGDLSHVFRMQQVLAEGDIICMPCDRRWGSAKAFRLPFLGGEADFPAGPFAVAAQLGKAMIAIFAMKTGAWSYTVHVRDLSDGLDHSLPVRQLAGQLAGRYAAALGEMLRKYPLQWFNFYDFWN